MRTKIRLACVFIFAATIFFGVSFKFPPGDLSVVQVKEGQLSGTSDSLGLVNIFKGIPFAAPPVGDLRWKDPQPSAHWQGVKKCDKFAASAMQNPPMPFMMWTKEFMAPLAPLSEDCLYLNVWTAAKTNTERRPVMVWIHGGAFTGGSGSVPLYDGENISKKGVVFVTINYRLGIFGFLAHPDLTKESPHHSSGNYGLLDQLAALRWVKDNIAQFGGDPSNVTVAGQSAGAFSVNALVASPLAKGLFQKAIAESGGLFTPGQMQSLATAEMQGMEIFKGKGPTTLDALRQIPADQLLKGPQMASPVVDGYVLPASVSDLFKQGKQNDVPLLTGFNRDEGFMFSKPLTATAYADTAVKKYGKLSGDFLKAFPGTTDKEAEISQKNFSRDQLFGWQNYTWCRLQTSQGKSPAYLYFFTHVPPGLPDYGAFHSAEFSYSLGTLQYWDKPFTGQDKELSNSMNQYWVNFAATGNPNGNGLPDWPAFSVQQTRVMEFGNEAKVIAMPAQAEMDFFTRINGEEKVKASN